MIPKIYMTLNTEFTASRVIDDMIIPNKWDLKVDLLNEPNADPKESAVSYQKMLFWLSEIIDSALISNIDDPLGQLLAIEADNTFITLPGEPSDDLICRVLAEKLSAIGAESGLAVLGLTLTAADTNITYHLQDVSDTGLPGIEYAIEKPKKGKKAELPWWKKPTSETSDFQFSFDEESDNIKFIPSKKHDILIEFGEQIRKSFAEIDNDVEEELVSTTTAKVIEPEWPTTNKKK